MAVRDYRQLSSFLKEIAIRLTNDQQLCKLLKYNDFNPLGHADLTETERRALIGKDKRIRIIPKINSQEESLSLIAIVIPSGSKSAENREIIQMIFQICVYVPISDWIIDGEDLRMFLIMSRIESVLDGKLIGGIGKFNSEDFDLMLTTDELVGYRMGFALDAFS